MGKTKNWKQYEDELVSGKVTKNAIRKWSELVPITIFVANNEQKPYDIQDANIVTEPMLPMKKLGFRQTGDYIAYLPEHDYYTGVGWERKSIDDLYSTLIHDRDRFYAECKRGVEIFDYFLVGVEGTLERFLTYRPGGKTGACLNSRIALVNELAPMFNYKVHVLFCSNRKASAKRLVRENRMWLKYHYEQVLGLENETGTVLLNAD